MNPQDPLEIHRAEQDLRHSADCPSENALLALLDSRVELDDTEPLLGHLDQCSSCRSALASMVRRGHTSVSSSRATEPPNARTGTAGEAGESVGRYLLLRRVGEGGMGVVYAAYDPELDRKVALKLVKAPARTSAARLAREAHALARVSHPNVVAVHDVGYCGDQVYVVMEFVSGVTFRRWLADRPRTTNEVLEVLRAAGLGLLAAHRANLVHRDVKPENIMVDTDGRPRVTDFGLACAAPEETESGASGEFAGTIGYMSPEQLRRTAVDARSDQFSFAVTVAEALTGRQVYAGVSRSERLEAVLRGPPQLKVALRGRLPRRLAMALARALDPDPNRRFASLDGVLASMAPRRSVALRVGAGVLATAALLSTVGLFAERHRAAESAVCRGAEHQLAGVWDAQRSARLAQGFASLKVPYAQAASKVTRSLLDRYAVSWTQAYTESCEATRLRKEQSEPTMDRQMACLSDRRRELDALASELAQPTESTALRAVSASGALGDVKGCLDPRTGQRHRAYVDANRSAQADALATRLARMEAQRRVGNFVQPKADIAALLADTTEFGDRRLQAEAQLAAADIHHRASEFDANVAALQQALSSAEADGDDELVAHCALGLFQATGVERLDARQAQLYESLTDAVIVRLGSPARYRVSLLRVQAQRAYVVSDYLRGIAIVRDALRVIADAGLGSLGEAAECHLTLGNLLERRRDLPEAVVEYQQALEIREQLDGPLHPAVADDLYDLAIAQTDLGHYEEARAFVERARSIFQSSGVYAGMPVHRVESALGAIEYDLENWPAAIEHYANALEQSKRVRGDNDATVLAYNNLGDALRAAGRRAEAKETYERGLAMARKLDTPQPEYELALQSGLGRLQLDAGQWAQALSQLESTVDRYEKGDFDPIQRAIATLALAKTLKALRQDRSRVRSLAERARTAFAAEPATHSKELADADALLAEAH